VIKREFVLKVVGEVQTDRARIKDQIEALAQIDIAHLEDGGRPMTVRERRKEAHLQQQYDGYGRIVHAALMLLTEVTARDQRQQVYDESK